MTNKFVALAGCLMMCAVTTAVLDLDLDLDLDTIWDAETRKGAGAITGSFNPPLRVGLKPSWGKFKQKYYELMPPGYYAAHKHSVIQPRSMNELGEAMVGLLVDELLPEIRNSTTPPQQGWQLSIKVEDLRPDGLPGFGLVFVENTPADVLVKLDKSTMKAEIIGIEPPLETDNAILAQRHLADLLAKHLLMKLETATEARTKEITGKGIKVGVDIRRDLVCAHLSRKWVPSSTMLAQAEKRETTISRILFAHIHDVKAKKTTSGGKTSVEYSAVAAGGFQGIALEGSIPLYHNIITGELAPVAPTDLDTVAKIEAYQEAAGDVLLGHSCDESAVFALPGIRDICVRTTGVSPRDLLNSKPTSLFAIQCLGLYPAGSVAVYQQQRNLAKGFTSTWVQRVCTPEGWAEPQGIPRGKQVYDLCVRENRAPKRLTRVRAVGTSFL